MSQSRIPMYPDRVLVDSLARHEERIIVQPIGIVLTKSVECAAVSVGTVHQESVGSFAKQALFEVDYRAVLDAPLRERRCIG